MKANGTEPMMRAVVQYKYGEPEAVLRRRTIPKPEPRDDEVLIRVRAASVHPDVWHVVHGSPRILRLMGAGVQRPKNPVPGTDVAGEVEAFGRYVTRFQPGDPVFGETVRGNQWQNGGAFAEYVAAPAHKLALKPPNISFEQAAAVPTSGLIAIQGVYDQGQVQAGQSVLVNGAGGGVGVIAVQLAKAAGATVTAVDSTSKLEMLRSIGADRVIDYAEEDFTQGDEQYDLIVDVPGNHPFSEIKRALTPDGMYVLIGHEEFGDTNARWVGRTLGRYGKMLAQKPFDDQMPSLRIPSKTEDPLLVLADLIAAGKLTPVIDRTFPLSQVPEAIHYLEEGNVQGKVVISV